MLSREYSDLLLSGVKKTTIRLGIVLPKYDEVIVHSGGRPIAKVKIAGVEYKKVCQLTDEDAKLDGFTSVSELVDALRRTYGTISDSDYVTIIKLEVVQRFNNLKSYEPYYGLNPSDVARIGLRYLRPHLNSEDLRILELLSRGLSIRRVADVLYGSPHKRSKIRGVLRKVLRELRTRNVIKVSEELGKELSVDRPS